MITRHSEILEILAKNKNISVTELSRILSVSEVTIRSDLTSLANQGKVQRTHGRVQLMEEKVRQEYSFQSRKNQNFEQKLKIGKYASQFVNSFDAVLLDASTTVLAMAKALREQSDLGDITVIPTGIWTAIELMSSPNINVLMPGGYLRDISGSITGMPTSDFFDNLNIQKAFLGAAGVSFSQGVTDTHLIEIELKKLIIKKAQEVVVLVDGSKFNRNGLASYAQLENISKIITDEGAPKDIIEKVRRKGIEVHIA